VGILFGGSTGIAVAWYIKTLAILGELEQQDLSAMRILNPEALELPVETVWKFGYA